MLRGGDAAPGLALALLLGLCLIATVVNGDIYMHNPRGSNNRLNEYSVNRDNNNRMCDTQNNGKGGYAWGPKMYYYAGSQLTIEWTAQHGCGPSDKQKNLHCEIIIQYTCGSEVRDGTTTTTIPDDANTYNEVGPDNLNGKGTAFKYGMHENYQYYQNCKVRERNKGLFIADQRLGGAAARFTRQNPGGGRSGFECPEERDYYPYWHPTPWKDIAVLTSDTSRCSYYVDNSENSKGRGYCSIPKWNNPQSCTTNKGEWKISEPNNAPELDCRSAPLSRDNHLGNGPPGYANTYNWTIPDDVQENCALRIRYNVSTGDYDNWNTFADQNGAKSPIYDDPYVPFYPKDDSSMEKNLSLALDTAQTARTFQDRSYLFSIRSKPSEAGPMGKIFNLNVRGKRGNIVQVYPAVEYDFVPQTLNVRPNDHIHFQWTGSDFNPLNYDGEGTPGTDRSNFVQVKSLSDNIPMPFDEGDHFFDEETRYRFAHLDQKGCKTLAELLQRHNNNKNAVERDPENCMKLNRAARYFDGGLIQVGASQTGSYYFIGSRNNNFSNRSQKATIISIAFLPVWAIVVVVLAGAACLISMLISFIAMWARFRPQSIVARGWHKLT